MRILMFGKTGQVGLGLQRDLEFFEQVRFLGRDAVDLTDLASVETAIEDYRPDVVINAAAYTNVDRAEEEPELAELVNATAPGVMAEMARAGGAWLIHYSTDYVFDGSATAPYPEDAAKHPLNVYGRTKSAGEEAIKQATDRYLILRTSWIYSNGGRNFLNTILRLAAEKRELRVVDDQTGTPTFARALSKSTAQLIERLSDGPEQSGVYNMTCEGATTWYGFACAILRAAGIEDVRVTPIATGEFPTPARRPKYSVLDNTRLHRAFGLRLPHWQDSLKGCLAQRAFT